MRPNNGGGWVTLKKSFHPIEIGRFGSCFRKRSINIVVQNDHQTNFRGKIQNEIESRILQAGDFARNFCRDEFLMNCELTDASEHSGKSLKDSANVVSSIHIRGIEAGNHRIKAALLFF